MWKITTRGFTLEEVLIMAAMNLLASADTANARNGRRRNQKETRTEVWVAKEGLLSSCWPSY